MAEGQMDSNQILVVVDSDIPFDEISVASSRRMEIFKGRESLMLFDQDSSDGSTASASFDSSSISSGEYSETNESSQKLEVARGDACEKQDPFAQDPIACGILGYKENEAHDPEMELKNMAATIQTDDSGYTHFPKKRHRIRRCYVDFGVSHREQSASPSFFLDVVEIWQGWLINATTNGQKVVLDLLEGDEDLDETNSIYSTCSEPKLRGRRGSL